MPHPNSWYIKREIGPTQIVVSANYIKPLSVWGLACKVDGHLVDHRQSDNPVAEAQAMVEAAILNGNMSEELVA